MTGPEHYEQAELHLAQASDLIHAAGRDGLGEEEVEAVDYLIDRARVHAQLAQVAATVEAGWPGLEHGPADRWATVLASRPVSTQG